MNPGLFLAWIAVGWPALSLTWKSVEDVSKVTYHSTFFHLYAWALAITQITLGVLAIAGTITALPLAWLTFGSFLLMIPWEIIVSPYTIKYKSRFYQAVHVTVGIVSVVLALIVIL